MKHNLATGRETHLVKSQKHPVRWLDVCYSAPIKGWRKAENGCRCHLEIEGEDTANCEIVSVDLNHACELGLAKRKRNVPTKRLARTSEALDQFQPGKEKAGITKRFQGTAKATFAVTIKKGQAHNAVNMY